MSQARNTAFADAAILMRAAKSWLQRQRCKRAAAMRGAATPLFSAAGFDRFFHPVLSRWQIPFFFFTAGRLPADFLLLPFTEGRHRELDNTI